MKLAKDTIALGWVCRGSQAGPARVSGPIGILACDHKNRGAPMAPGTTVASHIRAVGGGKGSRRGGSEGQGNVASRFRGRKGRELTGNGLTIATTSWRRGSPVRAWTLGRCHHHTGRGASWVDGGAWGGAGHDGGWSRTFGDSGALLVAQEATRGGAG
jgi:hypothetical protein